MWERPARGVRLSIGVQVAGFVIDAIWHGILSGGAEPATTAGMAIHLATIHLVFYIGVLGLFASLLRLFLDHGPRGLGGGALMVAFAGSVVQVIGETWHAVSHLRLRATPTPELVAYGGLVVAVAAFLVARRATHTGSRDGGRR